MQWLLRRVQWLLSYVQWLLFFIAMVACNGYSGVQWLLRRQRSLRSNYAVNFTGKCLETAHNRHAQQLQWLLRSSAMGTPESAMVTGSRSGSPTPTYQCTVHRLSVLLPPYPRSSACPRRRRRCSWASRGDARPGVFLEDRGGPLALWQPTVYDVAILTKASFSMGSFQ